MTGTPTHHFVLSRVVTDGLDDNARATAETEVKNLFQLACLAGVACQPVDISVQLTDALTDAINQFNVQHGIAAPPFDRTRPHGISFAKVLAVPSQSSTSSYVIVLDSALWSQSSAENVVYRAHGLARLLSHIVVKHRVGRATPIPKTALGPYAFNLWQRVSVLCDAWDEQVTAVGICNACLRDQEGNAVPLTEFVGGQSMQMVSEFLDQLCIFASFDVQFYRVTAIGLDDLPPTALSLSEGLLASVLEAASLFAACNEFERFCSAVTGLPVVFQEVASFHLAVGDQEPDGTVVRISVSKGTKDFMLVGEVTLSGRTATFTHPSPPEHQSPLRYRFEADGYTAAVVRAIALDHYSLGVVIHSRSASKHSLFKKAKKAKGEFECDLEFPGVGSHHVDILHGKHVFIGDRITGHDTSAESSEPQERPINKSGDSSAATLIQTDDESVHEFTAEVNGDQALFRLYVRASDAPPVGAASEFDRLILEHRSTVRRAGGAARVEPAACRANDLEHWLLEDQDSFHPLVLGEDYLEAWATPQWKSRPTMSAVPMQHDPRPETTGFQPPEAYVQARTAIQAALREGSSADELVETVSLGERMRDEAFRKLVTSYLDEYTKWLRQDYDSAVWSDVVTVHRLDPNGAALSPYPHAILLTPLHPVRFGWQSVAQALLQHGIDHRLRCPAASILDPRSTPDCLVLACRTPVGKVAHRIFLSVASSSDYWGVLWSGEGDQLRALDDEAGRLIFDKEFGITIEGLASGFSVPQVERAIDEMAQIWSAKSTLRVSVTSDTRGSSSCNEGISSWARKVLGEQDPWRTGGARALEVYDEREDDLQPEDAELSTLTQVLDSSIRWYSNATSSPQADLAIIAHLGTQSPELDRQGLSSPIDAVGLNRVRVRRQLAASEGKFIAESRVGKHESAAETIEALPEVARSASMQLAAIVQAIEGRCAEAFDSYVFMPKKPTLERAVDTARYCAVSSTNIDPACFFTVNDKSYLWDYDLPSYSRRAGENSGFYLIANESPTIRQAAQGAIKDLQDDAEVEDSTISRLLREISRRGVPTLKRLTGGGTASLGEIGVLTCLRTLQCEFAETSWPCIFPVRAEGSPVVNLVIPVDPFRAYFDELRQGLQLHDFERPDLLSISLRFEGDQLAAMKVTPIEVKARADAMGDSQLRDAIEQARIFALFLEQLAKRASEHAIWGIAHRHLIASWLDYAFRVYGQLRHLMESTDWHKWHGEVLAAILSGRIVPEVDSRGRLFVVGTAKESEKRDLDRDGLNEVLLISHADAFSILTDPSKNVPERLRNVVGDWQLSAASPPGSASRQPEPHPATHSPTPESMPVPIAAVPAALPAASTQSKASPPQTSVSTVMEVTAVGQGVRFAVGHTRRIDDRDVRVARERVDRE
ncbi:MAG: hypothetical protein RBS39_12290 [Phycisphaerales bacterium]|jgi:hypothetical protein|nr:hypothetical protein [Phycisphaerales bacterium]